MILTDRQILTAINHKAIVIEPFRREQLQLTSYDFRLGNEFIVNGEDLILDTITLLPGGVALARTLEAMGGTISQDPLHPYAVVPMMKAKSTSGRHWLSICNGDAGWGDPGYTAPWVLELVNNGPTSLTLRYGDLIGQLIFFKIEEPEGLLYNLSGSYEVKSHKEWCLFDHGRPKAIKNYL